MTEEELEQKAKEYGQANKLELVEQSDLGIMERVYKDGYKQGQESMMFDFAVEDRHELLSQIEQLKEKLKGFENGDVAWQGDMDATIKQNMELKKSEKELKSENEKLKEQLDKMKPYCKELCKNWKPHSITDTECYFGDCENCNKWGVL